ncbi:MAG: ABC transporter permease, partial [Kiritimatiellae bacterium]|nr:ABC transporter permease [Kiritimatiellia bacterium]
ALGLYVAADAAAFPAGMVPVSSLRPVIAKTAIASFAVAAAAVAFALTPALRVHPLEAAALRPRRPRRGMAVAFAFGFGAFVAVEVWGASLMMAFVPSPEWPDAIVSILPSGVDPCERPALDGIEGVRRISELYPLQLSFDPPVPVGRTPGGTGRGGRGGEERTVLRNALFLGAEWLPRFRFVEGDWESANEALFSGRACVVCSMLARARGLHKGDTLRVSSGGGRRGGGPGRVLELPVAAVVDLNWHMVTSRGLVRGLNGSPPMTDGVAFVSLATSCWLDPRPFLADVNITHLWVEYDKAFLAGNGVFGAGRIVESRIDERLGHPKHSTVRLHARDEIADGTLAHGSDVIGQAARVPFVFLSILSFGFVAMLVAAADARRDELATLRAIGATRAQLAWFLSRDALSCALRGMAAAVPLGALAGWLFTLKTGAIWPGLPHHFACPWRIVAEGALGAVAFVLAVAVPTSLRIVSRARLSGSGR